MNRARVRATVRRVVPGRVRRLMQRSRGGSAPAPGLAELYQVPSAWPVVASVFPDPYVFRPEGVDRDVLDRDPRWAGRSIVLPPVVVHDIPGAAIRASGLIQTAGGAVLIESVKRPGHLFGSPELRRAAPSVVDRDGVGTTISLAGRLPNYFHWLIDMIPRLYALEQHGGAAELVVPRDVPAFVEELLGLVVADPLVVVRCPPGQAFRYDAVRLSPFTTVWSHGLMRPEILAWLRRRLLAGDPRRPGAGRRIYLRRVGTRARTIANEDEVLATLARFEVEPVQPERLPVAEQLELFLGAELIVAPCGAGLANMVAADRAAVVDINPGGLDGHPSHPAFWSLARSCGHRYVMVPHGVGLHQSAYAVDTDRLHQAVELAVATPPDQALTAIV